MADRWRIGRRVGPSNIYRRLLAGRVTPERYVAVLKRAVDMRMRVGRDDRSLGDGGR